MNRMKSLVRLEKFIINGSYHCMLEGEMRHKLLRNQIREYQAAEGMKHLYWHSEGVAGIFDNIREFDEDTLNFKDFLDQLGLLPMVTKIRWKDLMPEEQDQLRDCIIQLPSTIRFLSSNTKKDADPQHVIDFSTKVEKYCIREKILLWKREKVSHEQLQKEWNNIKASIQLEMLPNESIQLDCGALSCSTTEPILRSPDIYRELGNGVFMSHGKIDSNKITLYLSRGFINKKEVAVYRKIKNIRVRYTLIEIEKLLRRNERYYQSLLR